MEERKDIAVPVEKLNAILGCKLCNGYFRNAHTIVECLHTFCRECLEDDLEIADYGKKLCPTCKLNLGIVIMRIIKISCQYLIAFSFLIGSNPKYIFDRTIQQIVDKIFPDLAKENGTVK